MFPQFKPHQCIRGRSPNPLASLLNHAFKSPTQRAFPGTNLQGLVQWLRGTLQTAEERKATTSETPNADPTRPPSAQRLDDTLRMIRLSDTECDTHPSTNQPGLLLGGQLQLGQQAEASVAQWDGSQWVELGRGLLGTASVLLRNGSCVYASGVLGVRGQPAGGSPGSNATSPRQRAMPRVVVWTAASDRWRVLDGSPQTGGPSEGSTPSGGPIRALARNGSTLLAVGSFHVAGGRYVALWNGGTESWSALPDGPDAPVTALALDATRGVLYVCGEFLRVGTRAAPQGIALWDGSTWFVPSPFQDPRSVQFFQLVIGGAALHALDTAGRVHRLDDGADSWWQAPELPAPLPRRPTAIVWAPLRAEQERTAGPSIGGALFVATDFVRYEHGDLFCLARLEGELWLALSPPVPPQTQSKVVVRWGEVTSLASGSSPWLPGVPVLLVAGRFGESTGLAWWSAGNTEDSSSRELAITGSIVAIGALPSDVDGGVTGPSVDRWRRDPLSPPPEPPAPLPSHSTHTPTPNTPTPHLECSCIGLAGCTCAKPPGKGRPGRLGRPLNQISVAVVLLLGPLLFLGFHYLQSLVPAASLQRLLTRRRAWWCKRLVDVKDSSGNAPRVRTPTVDTRPFTLLRRHRASATR